MRTLQVCTIYEELIHIGGHGLHKYYAYATKILCTPGNQSVVAVVRYAYWLDKNRIKMHVSRA